MLTALSCSSLGLHAGSAVLSRSAVGGQRSAALFMQETAAPEGWQAVKEELWTPDKKPDIRIEGGKTLKTFAMPSLEWLPRVLRGLARPSRPPFLVT